MNTPLSTPVRHAKLGISSSKSSPLTNEYKKLLGEQYQRLWTKHQQDLDLIDDIRSYVKARLSIERDYTSAINKLGKQHAAHISKKFVLLPQCDPPAAPNTTRQQQQDVNNNNSNSSNVNNNQHQDELRSDSRFQKRLANNGVEEPDKASSLYKVWSEHINRLQITSKNRQDQFEQLIMIVDKLKDIRSHKASIGKKCLDTHLKRIHEDILVSMVEIEKTRKLYYEDESQAKKARENEEKIKKKKSSLLTKFTDLQAKKEKTSAQREANDIQSTQARNDYIMALAAGNAHLQHYYQRDLNDFIHLIDDGVLDHCKIFMATLSECDINSLKDSLMHAQYWSKMINLTGSQKTNSIFLECDQSLCLRTSQKLDFEPCNNDPIDCISLEHNADYALQHEIDKWFTWFKKECRNLSQLMHMLDQCQHAFAEGKKSIELQGQTVEDLEPKIIELKQQIRKSEAAKLKAQARLKVIKEGGMQIEEWSAVESEIRADMARAQEEMEVRRLKEAATREESSCEPQEHRLIDKHTHQSSSGYLFGDDVELVQDQVHGHDQVHLQVSRDTDDEDNEDASEMILGGAGQLASVSRSNSNLVQKQQNAMSGYNALTDPSLVWQDDYSSAWGGSTVTQQPHVVAGAAAVGAASSFGNSNSSNNHNNNNVTVKTDNSEVVQKDGQTRVLAPRLDLLGAKQMGSNDKLPTSMTVQSSSPLSAVVDGRQSSPSPYGQGMVGEAYKSDYECDYNRNSGLGGHRSAASSAEPFNQPTFGFQQQQHLDPFGAPISEREGETLEEEVDVSGDGGGGGGHFNDHFGGNGGARSTTTSNNAANITGDANAVFQMLNREVVALYSFDKTNEDDLAFNESDVLRVIEISDANWVKARNEATGEVGFIPTSYVHIRDGTGGGASIECGTGTEQLTSVRQDPFPIGTGAGTGAVTTTNYNKSTPNDSNYTIDSTNTNHNQPAGKWSMDSADVSQKQHGDMTNIGGGGGSGNNIIGAPPDEPSASYCRAIYDYEPELNTFEEDGLPHLSLAQGELMRIIDQGEDDGWWLVEKQDESETRGHVPSMLVEEVELGEDEMEGGGSGDQDEDIDDGEASEYSDNRDYDDHYPGSGGSVKLAAPTFEPPPLPPPEDPEVEVESQVGVDEVNAAESSSAQETTSNVEPSVSGVEINEEDLGQRPAEEREGGGGSEIKVDSGDAMGKISSQSTGASLVPTSFIIIEPTPEVESRRIVDSIENFAKEEEPSKDSEMMVAGDEGAGSKTSTEPPASGASYSVFKEGFVLGGPPRKPEVQPKQQQQPPSPQLDQQPEEEDKQVSSSTRGSDENYEPLSEVNSVEIPMAAAPSVVIDVSFYEDSNNNDSNSISNNNNETNQQAGDLDKSQSSNEGSGELMDQDDQSQPQSPYHYVPKDRDRSKQQTTNVDVNPIIRMRAEAFSKQIIAEAIMLVPGTSVGPSTSSPLEERQLETQSPKSMSFDEEEYGED